MEKIGVSGVFRVNEGQDVSRHFWPQSDGTSLHQIASYKPQSVQIGGELCPVEPFKKKEELDKAR